ncbi:MAG: lamin tail domain-containing protein [Bacteroidetes bacterium]|nr:lamin tail domain-containing protein [Bacteroidota bacterium]
MGKNLQVFLGLLFSFLSFEISAQIVINEVQLINKGIIVDQDNEYPSWLEVYNAGNSAVNLKNFMLTDDSTIKTKWKFPSISLAPGARQLVFLSGKDTSEKIDHWESAVYGYDNWQYILGDSVWGNYSLMDPNYATTGWNIGKGGIGLADSDDSTVIKATSNYTMRKVFKLKNTNLTNLKKVYLQLDNENLCYAYLNGTYLATFNKNTQHIRNGKSPLVALVDVDLIKYYANYYDSNVLLLRYYNSTDSFHQTSIPFLSYGYSDTVTHVYNNRKNQWLKDHLSYLHSSFKIKAGETVYLYNNVGTFLDKKEILYSNYDIAYARIPDGGSWCISNKPTPDYTNSGQNCYSNFLEPPIFSINTGLVTSGTFLKLSTPQSNCVIRYTKNGDTPDSTSILYTSAIKLTKDVAIRAVCIDTTRQTFQSKPVTNTYILKDKTFKLPIISIVIDSLEMFEQTTGLYTGNGYVGAEKRPSHIEYMLQDGKLQFELDADLSIHGNGSRGYNKKSLRVEVSSKYDSSFIHYKLFPFRGYKDIYSFNLRSGSQDQAGSFIRDELTNHIMLGSNMEVMEHNSCMVYINGMPWGIYHMREKQDNDYLNNVTGIDKDSIDLIGIGGVHYGTYDAYGKLIALYNDSLNTQQKYDSLNKYLDIKSYTDYLVTETFICNNDWPGNNTKLWRNNKLGGKFRYLLYDTDFGTWDSNTDKLNSLINSNWFGMNTITRNSVYKKFFINRYADLLNTTLSLTNYRANIAYMKGKLDYDFPKEIARWGNYASIQGWYDGLNYIDTFVRKRLITARNQIQSNYKLTKQVNLTMNVYPAASGVVKLNTIVPSVFPWKGIYFDGNPITVTAVPNPGYIYDSMVVNGVTYRTKSLSINLSLTNSAINFYYHGSPHSLKISVSEINYNCNDKMNSGNWIELHNYDTLSIDLTGYKLKTSKDYAVYEFKDNFILPPNGYTVVCEDTALFKKVYPTVYNRIGNIGFPLDNGGDSIVIIDNKGKNRIAFVYGDTLPWPETVDGTGRTMELKSDTSIMKYGDSWFNGCIGGSPGRAYTPCVDNVYITEINYHARSSHDAGDWIELYNSTSNNLTLSNWHFKDGDDTHDFVFPAGTVIKPYEYLVVSNDLTKFANVYPTVINVVGPFNFGLSNGGEELRLFDTKMIPRFSMVYHNDKEGWPAEPDGKGYTLELLNKNADYSNKQNWTKGCLYGSPGKARDICNEEMSFVPTEINYKSLNTIDAGDWIEFQNVSKDTLYMSGWKLKTINQTYNLPSFQMLPNDFVLLIEDSVRFYNTHPAYGKSQVYAINLSLKDSFETIKLIDDQNIDRFKMQWVADSNDLYAKGNGYTLQLKKSLTTYTEYSLPVNWQHGCFLGNPGELGHSCNEYIAVSEINYNGDSLKHTADWVEIYNYGSTSVNLLGYQISTSNGSTINKTNEILAPKTRILVTNDSNNIRTNYQLGSLQMNFNLSSKDTFSIYNIDNKLITQAVYDSSVSIYTNGLGKTLESSLDTNYILSNNLWHEGCFGGSPGTSYTLCKPLDIVVSEINFKSNSRFNVGSWFELFNLDSINKKNISKYYISFNDLSNIIQLNSNMIMNPHEKFVFANDSNSFKFYFPFVTNRYAVRSNFINEGWVRVWDEQKNPVFALYFDRQFGGYGNGKTIAISQFSSQLNDYSNASFWQEGCLGGFPANEQGWCDTTLKVSEINYHSNVSKDADDWLELSNHTSQNLNLNGYYLFDSQDKSYILSGTLLKDSLMVLVSDSIKFKTQHPLARNTKQLNGLDLTNQGNVRIYNANKSLIYIIQWDNQSPWNDSADGKGYTLEFNHQFSNFNDASSWFIGCEGGSPGLPYQADCYIVKDTLNNGVTELLNQTQLQLFPNPTNGFITLYFCSINY